MTDNGTLRVVILQEKETGLFVAQCLEYDICTQAATIEQAKERFAMQLEAERQMSAEDTGEEFKGIPAAPEFFLELWDSGGDEDRTNSTHFRLAA